MPSGSTGPTYAVMGKTARWSWQWFHGFPKRRPYEATRRGWWRLSVLCHPRLIVRACAPERVRAISTARLCASPRLHLRPIYVVVSDGPIGDLILGASCLDAFSTYPVRTRIPGGAADATTGSPAVRPTRSSRTSVGSPQISHAHNR